MFKQKTTLLLIVLVFLVGGFFVVSRVFGVGLGTPLDMGGRDVTNVSGLNATGQVKGGQLCISADCRTSWPVDTDTRCDTSGRCGQVCVGSDCRTSWPTGGVATCDACDARFVNQWETWANSLTVTGRTDVASAGGGGGYISSGNYGGTGTAAYFPSGLWSNGSNAWIYGTIYVNGAVYDTSNRWSVNPAGSSWFNGGNVGIGTASPSVKLDVAQNGAIKVGQAYLSSGGDYTHLANNEWYNGSAWTTNGSAGVLYQQTGQANYWYIHDAAGGHTVRMTLDSVGKLTAQGDVCANGGAKCLSTMGGDNLGNHTATQNLNMSGYQIQNAGSVGIGITTPATMLQVYGPTNSGLNEVLRVSGGAATVGSGPSIGFHDRYGGDSYPTWKVGEIGAVYSGGSYGGDILFYTNTGSTATDLSEKMRITRAGYVGIGTTNPQNQLELVNPYSNRILVQTTDSSASAYSGIRFENTQVRFFQGVQGAIWNVYENTPGYSGSRLTILSGGNVGIGVTGPSQKLDVNGYVKGTGLCIGLDCRTSWPTGGDNLGNHTATQNLNMSGWQIQNFRIENRTSDPASPAVGQMWIRTDL